MTRGPARVGDSGRWGSCTSGLEATVVLASPVCESCGQRPSSSVLCLPDAEPFAVCADCAPIVIHRRPADVTAGGTVQSFIGGRVRTGRLTVVRDPQPNDAEDAVRQAPGEWTANGDGDVPPWGWTGTIQSRLSGLDVVQSLTLLGVLAVVCWTTFTRAGGDTDAFVRMATVGVVGLVVVGALDTWLLRLRDRRTVDRFAARLTDLAHQHSNRPTS